MAETLPVTFQEKLKQELKGRLADLLSDEEYTKLIQSTHQEFVRKDLPEMVKNQIREHYAALVRTELADNGLTEWKVDTSGYGQNKVAATLIKKVFEDGGAELLLGSTLNMFVINALTALRNARY